jgi:lysozyme
MNRILGVDISHWQGSVDAQKLKDYGVAFAIVKMGEYYAGREYDDSRYGYNMFALEEVGIPHSSYYFYHPAVGNSKQLRHFERLYKEHEHDFAPVLDVEAHDGMGAYSIARQVKVMLEGMEEICGEKPIVYTNALWWDYYAGDPLWGGGYKFWLAQYNYKMTNWTETIKDNIIMWQFTDRIKIPGCSGMDGNYWMGSEEEFRDFVNKDITIQQIEENRIKKKIFALSRANRNWIEKNLGI